MKSFSPYIYIIFSIRYSVKVSSSFLIKATGQYFLREAFDIHRLVINFEFVFFCQVRLEVEDSEKIVGFISEAGKS